MAHDLMELTFNLLVAANDVKEKHCSAQFRLDDESLVFSLEGLHQAVLNYGDIASSDCLFSRFQKTLYASNLNERLRQQRLKISVKVSTGKVKKNWYQLENL